MADQNADLLGTIAAQPEPQGLLSRHFWQKHTAETNAHNVVISQIAAAAHDPDLQSPEASHLLNSTLYDVSGKKPSDNAKFLQSGKLQQVLDQAAQMEKAARSQRQPSAPLGQDAQGGTIYGRFSAPAPPPDAFGQQSAPAQQMAPQQPQFMPPAPPPGPGGMQIPTLGPGVGLGSTMTNFNRSQLENAQQVAAKIAESGATNQSELQRQVALLPLQTQQALELRKGSYDFLTNKGMDPQEALLVISGLSPTSPVTVLPDGSVYDHREKKVVYQSPKLEKLNPGENLFRVPPSPPGGGEAPKPELVASGGEKPLTGEDEAARRGWIAKQQQTNPNYKWTDADIGPARAAFDEARITPTDRSYKKSLEAYRNERVQILRDQTGPVAVSGWVDSISEDPALVKNVPPQIRSQVSNAFKQKTGMEMPRPLAATSETNLDNNMIGLNHIKLVRELLQDPVILKRIGPVMGRIGNAEQTAGLTAGLTPDEAEKISAFRGALEYLYLREGKALFGGRPPEKLMEHFAQAAATPKEDLPMLLGSLKGAELAGRRTVQTLESQRFGGKKVPPGMSVLRGLDEVAVPGPPPPGNADDIVQRLIKKHGGR